MYIWMCVHGKEIQVIWKFIEWKTCPLALPFVICLFPLSVRGPHCILPLHLGLHVYCVPAAHEQRGWLHPGERRGGWADPRWLRRSCGFSAKDALRRPVDSAAVCRSWNPCWEGLVWYLLLQELFRGLYPGPSISTGTNASSQPRVHFSTCCAHRALSLGWSCCSPGNSMGKLTFDGGPCFSPQGS